MSSKCGKMGSKYGAKAAGQVEATRDLVKKIEDERKKLEDVSFVDLSRPEVIERQQAFDQAVVQFMRKRLADETDREE